MHPVEAARRHLEEVVRQILSHKKGQRKPGFTAQRGCSSWNTIKFLIHFCVSLCSNQMSSTTYGRRTSLRAGWTNIHREWKKSGEVEKDGGLLGSLPIYFSMILRLFMSINDYYYPVFHSVHVLPWIPHYFPLSDWYAIFHGACWILSCFLVLSGTEIWQPILQGKFLYSLKLLHSVKQGMEMELLLSPLCRLETERQRSQTP